jgi:tripartite ATP-independent transporter DctM subunit
MLILVLTCVFIVLLAFNIPVCFTLLVVSTIYIFIADVPLTVLSHVLTSATDSFILTAIPLFILAANFMQRGEITKRIIDFSKDLVGHLPGGLAHVNVVASMIFSGMSGSALADAGGLGIVEVQMMREGGYDDEFTAAITAASSTIGPIVPPSIPLVLYGALARESVGKLFLGGAIPGILVGLALMIQAYFLSKRRNYPISPRPPLKEILFHFTKVFWPLLTPIIILGGIVIGFFTPTEAAAMAALYALVLGKFFYRIMSWKDVLHAIVDTAILTGVVVFIMAMAALWSWMITNEEIATMAVNFLTSLSKNPLVLLFLMNVILLFMGMLIEPLAIMIMVLPVILPILEAYGISILHYGVVMTVCLMIGLVTPPFGECLFLLSAITGLPVGKVTKSTAPYLLGMLTILFLITYIPSLVLWLPELLMK